MELPLTPEDRAFREEVPAGLRAKGEIMAECTREEVVRWFKILAAKGWIAPAWPKEAGGAGWTMMPRLIFDIEADDAGAPRYTNFGVSMCGPVLLRFGTAEQKARHLPGILNVDELWCRGYSEPGAGSDLASLRTRARRDGDAYVVNGSKICTTQAHWADRMFALVRTSDAGRKQDRPPQRLRLRLAPRPHRLDQRRKARPLRVRQNAIRPRVFHIPKIGTYIKA